MCDCVEEETVRERGDRFENTIARGGVISCAMLMLWLAVPAWAQAPEMARLGCVSDLQPGAAASTPCTTLGLDDAVAIALEHNLSLQQARLGPEAAVLDIRTAETSWTPQLSTRIAGISRQTPPASAFDLNQPLTNQQLASGMAFGQQLPWGSSYSVAWDGVRVQTNSVLARFQPQLGASATATIVQPLLRGLRFDAARAARATAIEASAIADAALRSTVALTIRDVRRAYWRWVHARDYLSVQRESLALAQRLLDGNRARVAAGAMAAVDVIEAEAEVARRSEVILVAATQVGDSEDQLRALMFEPGNPHWTDRLEPALALAAAAVETPVIVPAGQLQRREDLRTLARVVAIDDVDMRRLRNDRLPAASLRMDYTLQATAGTELLRAQGFTGPITGNLQRGYGAALGDLARFRYPSWSVELSISYPIGPARAEAELARVAVEQRQDATALAVATQQAGVEIRAAARAADANRQRLELTAAGVTLSERRLDAEERKFAVGLSTSFFIFQAQRDLALAKEARLKALLEYQLSLADVEAVQVTTLR